MNKSAFLLKHTHALADMNEGRIERYPWGGDYRPEARFRAGWNESGIRVWMECMEAEPLRRVREPNGPVWCDSCMEFFLAPGASAHDGYFNFEMNANGALLLGFCHSDEDMAFCDFPRERIPLTAQVSADRWSLDLTVPFDLVRAYFPDFAPERGMTLHGNFYKCGDETASPHFGCYFPIDAQAVPEPNFHRPAYYGELRLL